MFLLKNICPGAVQTDMTANLPRIHSKSDGGSSGPIPMLEAEDIACAVKYVLSTPPKVLVSISRHAHLQKERYNRKYSVSGTRIDDTTSRGGHLRKQKMIVPCFPKLSTTRNNLITKQFLCIFCFSNRIIIKIDYLQ